MEHTRNSDVPQCGRAAIGDIGNWFTDFTSNRSEAINICTFSRSVTGRFVYSNHLHVFPCDEILYLCTVLALFKLFYMCVCVSFRIRGYEH